MTPVQSSCSSAVALAKSPEGGAEPGEFFRVINSTGFNRRDLATVDVAAGKAFRVLDARGEETLSQVLPGPGGESDSATLAFRAKAPALGYATYRVVEADAGRDGAPASQASAVARFKISASIRTPQKVLTAPTFAK